MTKTDVEVFVILFIAQKARIASDYAIN